MKLRSYHVLITGSGETPVRFFDTANTIYTRNTIIIQWPIHVMITNAGGSYSSWKDLAVTRWREDSTLDNWGTFCYIRDEETDEFWSTSLSTCTQKSSQNYEAIFSRGSG